MPQLETYKIAPSMTVLGCLPIKSAPQLPRCDFCNIKLRRSYIRRAGDVILGNIGITIDDLHDNEEAANKFREQIERYTGHSKDAPLYRHRCEIVYYRESGLIHPHLSVFNLWPSGCFVATAAVKGGSHFCGLNCAVNFAVGARKLGVQVDYKRFLDSHFSDYEAFRIEVEESETI